MFIFIKEMNQVGLFIVPANAKVFGLDGAVLYETDFMTVSRSQIVWVIPSEATASGGGEE